MKFKLDENLGESCAALLRQAGHDVCTVPTQKLEGSPDSHIINVCKTESRCLVTLDAEFGNPLIYPPLQYAGIVLLRVPARASLGEIQAALKSLIEAAAGRDITGQLWVAQPGRVRVYDPEQ